MLYYIVKMILMLALVSGLAVGFIFVLKKYNTLNNKNGKSHINVVETVVLSPTAKLAVVKFGEKHILVAVTRNSISTLSEQTLSLVDDESEDDDLE